MSATVSAILRYPVKGLSAERLNQAVLERGEGLAHDRRFALAHGSTGFDPDRPTWLPKTQFLTLMRDERLAQLRVAFDPDEGILVLRRQGKQVVRADVGSSLGRTLVGQFFAQFMAGASRGMPRLVEAPGHMFSDSRHKYLSMVNLASVRDLERVVRRPVDALRFRANLLVDGLPAWAEQHWPGRSLKLGPAAVTVADTIERCAATNVDPETAERDLNIPLQLQRGFGHVTLGVYLRVEQPGRLRVGDQVVALDG